MQPRHPAPALPLDGLIGVGLRSCCPSPLAGEEADGGDRCLVLTPTLALPHHGGGERRAAIPGERPTPVSPRWGRARVGVHRGERLNRLLRTSP